MKQMFFGLVVINILIFAWFGLGPGRSTGSYAGFSVKPPPPGVEVLLLLGEDPEQLDPVGDKGSIPTVSFLNPDCYSVGPIAAKSTLREVRDLISTQGIKAEARREEYREFNGTWIYLPPSANRAEARRLVALLKSKGIKDLLIVPNGDRRNAVSLGFFRNTTAAKEYYERVNKLGFAPVLEESYRSGVRYWLDLSANQVGSLPDTLVRNLDTQYEVGISPSTCGASIAGK